MGSHINTDGEFQSDKHPDLPPDRLRLSLLARRSRRALRVLAEDYEDLDESFAADLRTRLNAIEDAERPAPDPDCDTCRAGNALYCKRTAPGLYEWGHPLANNRGFMLCRGVPKT